jgi:nicotinamidase-related amidase
MSDATASPSPGAVSPRLSPATSVLLVVDVQERLLPRVRRPETLLRRIGFLADAAEILGVAVAATEQYPKGLGPTVACLRTRLPAPLPEKLTFSCCGVPGLADGFRSSGRGQVVLAGMETHVCVAQTALDLLAQGFAVFVPADAISARGGLDHEMALRRLERAGAVLTTAEAVVFEWAGSAAHPRFKDLSRLVKENEVADG